jgi:hypothetical protein
MKAASGVAAAQFTPDGRRIATPSRVVTAEPWPAK